MSHEYGISSVIPQMSFWGEPEISLFLLFRVVIGGLQITNVNSDDVHNQVS